uniref:Uncharacterized protein n=1 Tax=Prymnesium polylepis TaxID=72548 RepID=A0A7S4HG56_9EUKA
MPDVPDQTWLTARVRDYLTVHGIAYDPKEHHMELVRRAQKREPLRGAAVPDASWPTADIRAWLRERRVDFDQAVHLELVLLARRHGTGSEETAVKTYRTLPMSTRQQWVPVMVGIGELPLYDYSASGRLLRSGPQAAAAQHAAADGLARAAVYEGAEKQVAAAGARYRTERRRAAGEAALAAVAVAAAYERADEAMGSSSARPRRA